MTDIRKAFLKAARPGQKEKDILDIILEERPDLCKEKPFCTPEGSYGYAFIFNNEVFKAPKALKCYDDEEITEAFEKEMKIHQALAQQNFPVPRITYTGKKAFFFGMEKKNGLSLKDAFSGVYITLSKKQRNNIAHAVAHFKATLEKADIGTPGNTFAPSPDDLLEIDDAREGLSSPIVQKIIRERAPDFLPALQKFLDDYPSRRPTLIHGDLHGGNILFDPKTGKVSAFLDFGFVKHSIMPDAEFATLKNCYDAAFALAVQKTYQKMTGKEVQTGSWECLTALQTLATRTAFARREKGEDAERILKCAAVVLVSSHHYGAYRAALMKPPI